MCVQESVIITLNIRFGVNNDEYVKWPKKNVEGGWSGNYN